MLYVVCFPVLVLVLICYTTVLFTLFSSTLYTLYRDQLRQRLVRMSVRHHEQLFSHQQVGVRITLKTSFYLYSLDKIWTFNLVYIYADWSFILFYDMTPLSAKSSSCWLCRSAAPLWRGPYRYTCLKIRKKSSFYPNSILSLCQGQNLGF
jgi:hypothetical protein